MITHYERGDMPIVGLIIFIITFIVGFFSFILITNDFATKYNSTNTGLMNNTSLAYNLTNTTTGIIGDIAPMFILIGAGFMIIMIILYFSKS